MKYETTVEVIDDLEQYKITLVSKPSRISRFFGIKSKTRTFIGERTVWHETTDGLFKRAGTQMESFLSDIESKHEYEEYLKKKRSL